MSSLLSRVEQAARNFTRILKNNNGDKNSASKKRKNAKEEGRGQRHIFKIKIGKGLLNFYLKIFWGGSVFKPYVYTILETTITPGEFLRQENSIL